MYEVKASKFVNVQDVTFSLSQMEDLEVVLIDDSTDVHVYALVVTYISGRKKQLITGSHKQCTKKRGNILLMIGAK